MKYMIVVAVAIFFLAMPALAQTSITIDKPSDVAVDFYDEQEKLINWIQLLWDEQSSTHCNFDTFTVAYSETIVIVCVFDHPLEDKQIILAQMNTDNYPDYASILALRDDEVIAFQRHQQYAEYIAVERIAVRGDYEIHFVWMKNNETGQTAMTFTIE